METKIGGQGAPSWEEVVAMLRGQVNDLAFQLNIATLTVVKLRQRVAELEAQESEEE